MKNIFISSTFRDMQAERDLVQEKVLSALREEARKYGDNVGVIDLRWGVDTSTLEMDEGSAKVLTVCLDEIDRSHPYMLIFLGERYGWIPRSELIEKAVKNRADKYTADDFEKSVTALEIEYGALSERYGDLSHCIVCFREPIAHLIEGEEQYIYLEQSEKGMEKLRNLKERIKRELGTDDKLICYTGSWNQEHHVLEHFYVGEERLEDVLVRCYISMFKDDWKVYENLSWQEKEQLSFYALIESKLRSFAGRENLLEDYYQKIINGRCPIILQGEVGCGKTSIMCKLIERLQKEGKNVFVFFSGTGSMSSSADLLVKQMVYYLENVLGIEKHFEEKNETKNTGFKEKFLLSSEKKSQYDEWMEYFSDLMFRLPKEKKVYFFVDALDQMYKNEHIEQLDFLTRNKSVQMVLSCTDSFELPMNSIVEMHVEAIPALTESDIQEVIDELFSSQTRNVYDAINQEMMKKQKVSNPLYISLLIQRLNMMDAEELYYAEKEEDIIAIGTEIIRNMPDNLEDAVVHIIENAICKIRDKKNSLWEVVNYIAVSRTGLREIDLHKIFEAKGQIFQTLEFSLLVKYLDSFFYIQKDNAIDFTHKVIRKGLLKKIEDRTVYEEELKEYIKSLDMQDDLLLREGMYYARITEDKEFAKKIIEEAYHFNSDILLKTIKKEAVDDGGKFYGMLIQEEKEEESIVRDFFQYKLIDEFTLWEDEMKARINITGLLVKSYEELYKIRSNNLNMKKCNCSEPLEIPYHLFVQNREFKNSHYCSFFTVLWINSF